MKKLNLDERTTRLIQETKYINIKKLMIEIH